MNSISNFLGEIIFAVMIFPAFIPAHFIAIGLTYMARRDWGRPEGAWADRPNLKTIRFFFALEFVAFVLFFGAIKANLIRIHI